MRTTFLNTHSLFYPSTLYGIVDARISRYFKKLTIGERSVKALFLYWPIHLNHFIADL